MSYTSSQLSPEAVENAVCNFKKGVENRNSSSCEELKNVCGKDAIHAAVQLAYNDAKRTLTGISKTEHNKKQKETALGKIESALLVYFKGAAPGNRDAFDTIHGGLCKIWIDAFQGSTLGTYGKAQKIVNMAFKYLYCCDNASQYSDHFKYCHVALDSFTLEWFCRAYAERKDPKKKKLVKGQIASWSAIAEYKMKDSDTYDKRKNNKNEKFYTYMFFQKLFRKWFPNESELTPFLAEFIYWPEIQAELAAEGFLLGLLDNPTATEKRDIINKELSEKLTEIRKILEKQGY